MDDTLRATIVTRVAPTLAEATFVARCAVVLSLLMKKLHSYEPGLVDAIRRLVGDDHLYRRTMSFEAEYFKLRSDMIQRSTHLQQQFSTTRHFLRREMWRLARFYAPAIVRNLSIEASARRHYMLRWKLVAGIVEFAARAVWGPCRAPQQVAIAEDAWRSAVYTFE